MPLASALTVGSSQADPQWLSGGTSRAKRTGQPKTLDRCVTSAILLTTPTHRKDPLADPLVTPWSHLALDPPPVPPPVSFARLAAPVGRARMHAVGPDLLACPWQGTEMTLRRLPVTALPTLAPTVPAPRAPAAEALEPA